MEDDQTNQSGFFDNFNFTNLSDSFTQLASGYFGMRQAEAQADANGSGQAALNTAVEQNSAVGNTPLQSGQYQQVGASVASNTPTQGGAFGLSTTQLLVGGLALFLLLKR